MKKTKKALASLAITGMLATMIPFNALASVPDMGDRLAGMTAYDTAQKIAQQTESTDSVVLAAGMTRNSVDALAAGPLAAQLNAPILLTDGDGTLTAQAKAELQRLMPKKVYVTSGTAVILPAALAEVEAITGAGSVVALGGFDAYATSLNIAQKMVELGANPTQLFIAGGWATPADALSAASIAAAKGAPILAVSKTGLTADQAAFVATLTAVTNSYVVGGTAVIDAAVEATLPGTVTRLAGLTQYDTNLKVLQNFTDLDYSKVFVANGKTFVDALAGAPLAAEYGAPIVLTDQTADASLATYVRGQMTATSQVVALGGTAAVPASVVDTMNGITQGTLSVTSVSAVSANSFKVVFNQAPADTSKVTFDVKNGGNPVTVSATWNNAKTEATLAKSSNFVIGSYTVGVKNDATDLGTSTVSITEQKIAKIEITSTKLAVTGDFTAGTQKVIGTYKVFDNYGNDITTGSLANSINFSSGVGSQVTGDDGIFTITTTINVLTFSTVSITGFDTTSGISTTATLAVTTQTGTLSDIQLGTALTNTEGKILQAGDSTSVFYLPYTAYDLSGNQTTDLNTVKGGLILQNGPDGTQTYLITSNPDVTAQIVADPSDSKKAAIEVKNNGNNISMDMPVQITAMTYSSKNSQFSTTLKKQVAVSKFTLMAPSYDIASGESKQIPFLAVDQNGTTMTKYADIVGNIASPNVSVSGAAWSSDSNGNAILKNNTTTATTQSVPLIITATVGATGNYSTITINIQKPVTADTLAIDATKLVTSLQAESSAGNADGAVQSIDFGWNNGGLAIKDQYGRNINMSKNTTDANSRYTIVAASTNNAAVGVLLGRTTATVGQTDIAIVAKAAGSATVQFKLYDGATLIDTKSVSFSVLADKDITGVKLSEATTPLYAINEASNNATDPKLDQATLTDLEMDYAAKVKVFGTTSGGSKVALRNGAIAAYSVDSSDFATYFKNNTNTFDNLRVIANKFTDTTKTGATGIVTATVNLADANGNITPTTATTTVTSKTDAAVAQSLDFYVDTSVNGVTQDSITGDITVTTATLAAAGLANGAYLMRNAADATVDTASNEAAQNQVLYFYEMDQYGKEASAMGSMYIVSRPAADTAAGTSIANTGKISGNAPFAATGDYKITAITKNGLVKTIVIHVV